jgi:peptidoglycan-associated lipoprotein
MNAKLMTVSAVALALGFVSQARAQTMPEQVEPRPLPAPTKALELVVGTGYTQGFGSLQSGVNMQDVIRAGIGVDAAIAYRATPYFSFGVTGQYQEFTAERANSARGFTAGIQAALHTAPYSRVDPFFTLGGGYRGLWENPNIPGTNNLSTQGFELAKLQFGVDFRASRDVAIAPVIGGDLSLPVWQSVGNTTANTITDPRVSAFVFAGLQARFDVTSSHEAPARPVVEQTTVTSAPVTTPTPPVEATPQPQPQEQPQASQAMKPVCPSINVSEEILHACGLEVNDVEAAPKFDFNKSDLLPKDQEVLQKIADCFENGALKGNSMLLVGRADPRGTVAYNDKLGLKRANNVASFLEQHGLANNRIQRVTRGERDARGTNEETWAVDRRVDILVAH